MLINNIKVKENRIIAILEKNKKTLLNLEEYDINENTVYDEINKAFKIKNYTEEKLQRKQEELFKMVNLSESLLQRKINTLSDTEKIKIYFSKKLINNNDEIIIDDFLRYLDKKNKNKILKILLKLKKYHNKTIYIYTNNLNDIYDIIDDIIYIEGNEILYNDKYTIFNEISYGKPDILIFTDKLKEKYPNITYKDSINELIKEIYRELR